jgi:hypothetical protein
MENTLAFPILDTDTFQTRLQAYAAAWCDLAKLPPDTAEYEAVAERMTDALLALGAMVEAYRAQAVADALFIK